MTIHEFGKEKNKVIVLIHPTLVMWDYFEYVVPLLEKKYHLIIPALPGYDPDQKSDFTSVEYIAAELEDWLLGKGITEINCIYGCSMGGSVVIRFLADNRVITQTAVIDGGITPYRLPWIVTRLIALRDFLLIYLGKVGGIRILEKAFSTDEYSKEDLQYVAKVLKMISPKTIWQTFDSCNNYSMPDPIKVSIQKVEYWYAETEEKDRKWDIEYVKEHIPQTGFRKFGNVGHGGLAVFQPENLASILETLISEE